MTVPSDYPFYHFHGDSNSSAQPGPFCGPLPTGLASARPQIKPERLEGTSEEGLAKGIRCHPPAFQQPQPPKCRRGNGDDPHPEPGRNKQGTLRGFLTPKLNTSCTKAVKQSVPGSLGTPALKDQGGFHNNLLNPPRST